MTDCVASVDALRKRSVVGLAKAQAAEIVRNKERVQLLLGNFTEQAFSFADLGNYNMTMLVEVGEGRPVLYSFIHELETRGFKVNFYNHGYPRHQGWMVEVSWCEEENENVSS